MTSGPRAELAGALRRAEPAGALRRAELAGALRRAGIGGVDTSARRRAEYSSDASLYRVVPAAVVQPRDADEVAAALDVCRAAGVPFTVRGSGTSIAGNAVGAGVVADLRRHLGTIVDLDAERRTAVVQPGVVLADLQAAARPHGLRFGPDPSTHDRCTVGGMIGNNACGSRALAYGRTADNLVELDCLAGTGERFTARRGELPAALAEVVAANLGPIRTGCGRFSRQGSGYPLEHLLPEHGADLPKALAGTEGTCVVVLRATVRLVPLPAATALVVLGYPDLPSAADAVPALLPLRPLAIEGMDHRIVDVVRARRGPAAVPPLPPGRGWLFVEVAGVTAGAAATDAAALARLAGTASRVVTDPAEAATLWRIREQGAGLSARSPAGRPAHAGWEDAAVPPERLGAYLRDFDALLAGHGLTAMPYGHFGDGCVHARIDFPLDAAGGTGVFRRFLHEAAVLVVGHGGSMSGEHGDGRARGELLPLMFTPALIDTFAAVKHVFDPDDVLNPGVLVRPRPLSADLRRPAARPVRTVLRLPHDGDDLTAAVHRCTGVGACTADRDQVMCPSYLATRDEKDSTRGRARVLQELVDGRLVGGGWRAPEVHDSLDLCLACKGCASDCPTGVDMAAYKAEVLHRRYAGRLRPRAHYSLGRLPAWARLAARAPALANALTRVGPLGTMAKAAAGIDRRRPLPRFAGRTFRSWFDRRRPVPVGAPLGTPVVTPVVLWVDTFTDHFTPWVGVAAVRVLEAAGFAVRIPSARVCCGLTWYATGQFGRARRELRSGLAAVAAVAAGAHGADGADVVGLEPSCLATLRGDAAALLGPDDPLVAVAGRVRTLAELLTGRGAALPGLSGRFLAQPHCHQHAVLGWDADRELLAAAGADVTRVAGCCGLAGGFGMERGHYDVSVAVASTRLLPAVRAAGPDAVLLADGFSCRTQLDHLTGRRAYHLAEVLAGGPAGPTGGD